MNGADPSGLRICIRGLTCPWSTPSLVGPAEHFVAGNFGTLAQLAAGAACIFASGGACLAIVLGATALKVTQDLANHTSGAQTVTDAIIGVLGASYAGVAATAVFGLEDGSVAGLNALIEEISASGESAAGLRALVALLRATGFAPSVISAITDELEYGQNGFGGICVLPTRRP